MGNKQSTPKKISKHVEQQQPVCNEKDDSNSNIIKSVPKTVEQDCKISGNANKHEKVIEDHYINTYEAGHLDNYNKYFLVLGYLQQHSSKYKLTFPFDIEYLITCFCRNIDKWDDTFIDKILLKIHKNKLKSIDLKYGVLRGSHIVTNNECYTWNIMMVNYNKSSIKNEEKTLIGIMESNTYFGALSPLNLLQSHHYLLNCSNGKIMPGDRRYTTPFIKSGDVMQIKLDMTEKINTLSFNINNQNFGVAFMGITGLDYVLVAMIGNGTEIQII